jgi:hypothetical protein
LNFPPPDDEGHRCANLMPQSIRAKHKGKSPRGSAKFLKGSFAGTKATAPGFRLFTFAEKVVTSGVHCGHRRHSLHAATAFLQAFTSPSLGLSEEGDAAMGLLQYCRDFRVLGYSCNALIVVGHPHSSALVKHTPQVKQTRTRRHARSGCSRTVFDEVERGEVVEKRTRGRPARSRNGVSP